MLSPATQDAQELLWSELSSFPFLTSLAILSSTMRELRNAVAVITGAASGIGRALAQQLAAHGAKLALSDLNSAGLQETLKLLGTSEARTYLVDVAKAAEVEK